MGKRKLTLPFCFYLTVFAVLTCIGESKALNKIETPIKNQFGINVLFFSDSLEYVESQEELARIKEIIDLSREREVEIFQLLLNKNHFLNNPIISDLRANLTLDAYKKEFESLLNSDELEDINNSGLIEEIFRKKNQD